MGKHVAEPKGILTIVENDGSPTERHEFHHTGEFISLIRQDASLYIASHLAEELMDWANATARHYQQNPSRHPYRYHSDTTQYTVTFQ